MSYSPPIGNAVGFDFVGAYISPNGSTIRFELGLNNLNGSAYLLATTDDAVGSVIGFNAPSGRFSATTDDAVGSFAANNPFIHRGVLSATTDDAVGSFDCAIVKTIHHVSSGFSFNVNQSKTISRTENSVLTTSDSTSNSLISVLTDSKPVIDSLGIVLQQCDVVRHYSNVILQDCHLATHKFNTQLFKEPPLQYRYTPSTVFDCGVTLNTHTFADNERIYDTNHPPIHFDLIEAAHTGGHNFNLTDEFDYTLSPLRTVFESVGDYVPEPLFFAAWANDNLVLNWSYERAGMRIATNVIAQDADNVRGNYFSDCVDSIPKSETYFSILAKSTPIEETVIVGVRTAKPIERTKLSTNQTAIPRIRQIIEREQNARPIWNTPFVAGGGTIVDPPRPPPYNPPDHVTVTISTKQVYQMQHTITVTLENLTPINVDSVKLSLDADSFAWSFSANLLDLSQLYLVKQPTNAPPVTLVITIDGTVFKMLVEKITRNRSFAKNSIALSGRSLSALLSSPYEQPRSATQSSLMTVQQIAALELPTGWTLSWMCQDWNVPSGAYS